ncbi:MAG: PorP/SprF family type IX secretion system membrane protein, partial [Bacteroidota bacterium]
ENDPAINNVAVTSGSMAMDAGAYYQSERLFFGLSATHLDASRLRASDGLPAPFGLRYDLVRHYHVQAGYRWTWPTDPDFEVRPTLLVQTDLTAAQVTATTRVVYQERLWGGVGYRHEDALILLAGVRVAAMGPGYLRAGYAYDLTISGLSPHTSGSHELLVTYCWPFVVHRESYTPVRWLGNSAGVPNYRKP